MGETGASVHSPTFAPSAARASTGQKILRKVGKGLADWLPALPLFIVAGLLLVAPTVALVVRSFRGDTHGWTLQYWDQVLHRPADLRAIRTSLKLGAICGTIALVIGAPSAWLISKMVTARRSTWLALLNVAANFGGVGLAFGFIAVLGTYGMFTLLLQNLGLPFSAPRSDSLLGFVLAYSYTNVPLFVLLTLPAMGILRTDWMEAAEVSAASRLQFWRYVGVPILTPFFLAGWILIFTWSTGIYGLAFAMAGDSGSSRIRLITLQIGFALNSAAGSPYRAAVHGVLLLLFAAVSLTVYRLILRWALRWFS